MAGFTLPNGLLVEYAYDAASRVTGITYKQNGTTVLGNLTYEYDKAGNRTKIGGSFARTGVPQSVNSTASNAANRQTTFGDKTLAYDDNGNLTSITDANGTTLYSWNARNQMIGVSGPNVDASFVYDALGRREKKTVNGNLTEFLYDGVNPVQESSGAAVLANILTGLGVDEFLARTDVAAGTTSSFLPDGLGSALALADSAGVVQTEYTYEPFGRTTLTGAANTSSYQYTGRENDGTGLYYYRARYYHLQLQRFISEDPIEFAGGDINLYAYVWNDPLSFLDPQGLGGWGTTILRPLGRLAPNQKEGPGPGAQNPVKEQQARPRTRTRPANPNDPNQPTEQMRYKFPDAVEGPHDPIPCLYVPGAPGCGGHGGIIPPQPLPGGGRKDPPPHPVCKLGLCPEGNA